jgi:hypothetical protein
VKCIRLVSEVLLYHLILTQPIETFPLLRKGVANHCAHRHWLFDLLLKELSAVNNHQVPFCFSKPRFPFNYAYPSLIYLYIDPLIGKVTKQQVRVTVDTVVEST